MYAENKARQDLRDGRDVEEAEKVLEQITTIRKHRHKGQPYVSVQRPVVQLVALTGLPACVLGVRDLYVDSFHEWSTKLRT